MKLKNILLAVKDIDISAEFYKKVLGLHVIADFGANKTLTGGLCLQTVETWQAFIAAEDISFGANAAEIYFEEDDFTGFLRHLQGLDIRYVHPPKTHSWGQQVVRFYDPDRHIIEVGESLRSVCRRFAGEGKTEEEIAQIMDVPLTFVKNNLKK